MGVAPRILVTGASGQIGREVVAQLSAAGLPVRALSRKPQMAVFPDGVEVVGGDLTAPEMLDDALRNVAAVFLVWVAPLAPAARAIERIASRAERIVFLSAPIHTNHPFFQQPNDVRNVHAAIEDLIEKSGLRWTMLRPGPFALNYRNWWARQIRTGDVVRWFYGAAETAAVHERDIAAVAVRALSEEQHHGRDYVLTGPESLTQREQLAIIGDVIGRTLTFAELSPDRARREVMAAWPTWVSDMLLSAYAAAVDRPALVTPTIEEITGTPARSFRDWATDHFADFAKR
ncbi:MAG TPA: NAD(P)H-binding protein [Vicinamibacterales bacterium]